VNTKMLSKVSVATLSAGACTVAFISSAMALDDPIVCRANPPDCTYYDEQHPNGLRGNCEPWGYTQCGCFAILNHNWAQPQTACIEGDPPG
jgi:hypothetical protein